MLLKILQSFLIMLFGKHFLPLMIGVSLKTQLWRGEFNMNVTCNSILMKGLSYKGLFVTTTGRGFSLFVLPHRPVLSWASYNGRSAREIRAWGFIYFRYWILTILLQYKTFSYSNTINNISLILTDEKKLNKNAWYWRWIMKFQIHKHFI